MKKVLLIIILLSCSSSVSTKARGYELSLGTKFRSVQSFRGVNFYNSWQLWPVIYLSFYDDRVQFIGNGLEFRDYILRDSLRLRTKIQLVRDEPLYETSGVKVEGRDLREDSIEWKNTLEYFIHPYGEFNWFIAKDLSEHFGFYSEIIFRLYLLNIDFLAKKNYFRLEGFYAMGYGDDRHNQYIYGDGAAISTVTNQQFGFLLTLPGRVDTIYSALSLTFSDLIGSRIQTGSLVRENQSQVELALTFTRPF